MNSFPKRMVGSDGDEVWIIPKKEGEEGTNKLVLDVDGNLVETEEKNDQDIQ